MDYSKSGGVKQRRNTPRHSEHNQRGSEKTPYGAKNPKAELLARMKAAAKDKADKK
ncbi:hypothetical protein [Pseudoprimorskyibacter insulae]|uniref:Cobalt chelatase n=1 Tax=Pseudoprimorskyibacter insulae TaxID=1695997 RepID=A0A2R8ARA2_9RHOB|nr:hypothetical protein [Pseudoprimorskyibacter insulae]SPF78384.1 hypothetical protein PRI8871_00984 [Pseudoprimorskyibacter insulae]